MVVYRCKKNKAPTVLGTPKGQRAKKLELTSPSFYHRKRKNQMLTIGANCYLLTSRNVLMPGILIGEDSRGLYEVESPNGRVYTCNPANVYDEQAGRIMLFHRRAEELANQGYKIAVRNDGTFRVYSPRKHVAEGGYIVRDNGLGYTCNCPACAKEGICKHIMGVTVLLWSKEKEARDRNWKSGATRYGNLAVAFTA